MIDHLPMILIAFFGMIASFLITPLIINYMRSIGKVGIDVHKKERPEIAESGGIGFMFIFIVIIGIGIIIAPSTAVRGKLILSLVILTVVTLIGLYDDFRGLSAKMKPLLLLIAAFPVYVFRQFNGVDIAVPRPVLPFVGAAQLTIVYWALAIFVISIPANASNMMDTMNGLMSGSSIIILLTAFLASFIMPINGSVFTEGSMYFIRFMSLAMIAVLIGFWWYNRYPATVFAGDTGSLGVGATIGLIAIYGQIEFVMVVALLVHIMNSFSIISSLGGLQERHEMKERPVRVEDGVIYPSKKEEAPITLIRLLVAREPTTEDQVIRQILGLVIYSCLLALLSAYIIRLEVLRA